MDLAITSFIRKSYSMTILGNTHSFIAEISRNNIHLSRWHILFFYFIKIIISLPFYLYERHFLSNKIRRTKISRDPVFIIGHYRSGTTYLYKLLTANNRWAFVSEFDIVFPYCPQWIAYMLKPALQLLINLFNIKHPHFNDYKINLDEPNDDEGLLMSLGSPYSIYWSKVFPLNAKYYQERNLYFSDPRSENEWKEAYSYLIKRIMYKKKAGWLLLKNPPDTGRIRALLDVFPGSKFIFLYREPTDTFYSTRNLWKNQIERFYSLQHLTDEQRDELILLNYTRMMDEYEQQKSIILPGNLVEIKYEALVQDPCNEIKRIYEVLTLEDLSGTFEALKKKIQEQSTYKPYQYNFDQSDRKQIKEKLKYYIAHLGY